MQILYDVQKEVEQKQNQIAFLQQMILEMDEKLKVEQRKKTILKSQCDQAYLRGVSSISMEALHMSGSTLQDYYKGMKMPKYDGRNIFN